MPALPEVDAFRILLVEDDEDFAMLVEDALAEDGFWVDVVYCGREALNRELGLYDCALLDWNLPDITSLELIEHLGAGRRLPIVMFTGERATEAVVGAMKAGATDYLLKSMQELVALPQKLRKVIASFRSQAERERLRRELEATNEALIRANGALEERRWELEQTRDRLEETLLEREAEKAELREACDVIERMSKLDPLTGVYNRRAFHEILDKDFAAAERYGHCLSLVMADVDNFKRINDECGHLVGDQVLQGLAAMLEASTRRVDSVARFGGDEFVILLPHTDRLKAGDAVQKLTADLAEMAADPASNLFGQHFSFGIATYPDAPVTNGEELIQKADMALLKAKRSGKGRYEFWNAA